MKTRLALALLILSALTITAPAQRPDDAAWQMLQTATVELGIRDKQGTAESYEAEFIVTAPDGKRYNRAIVVEGAEWGIVSFPEDFDTYPRTGHFSWVCVVNGKTILRGRFRLTMDAERRSFLRSRVRRRVARF